MGERVILEANQANLSLALKAAQWLLSQPKSQHDAILGYGNGTHFYVRRNKSSISSREIPQSRKAPQ